MENSQDLVNPDQAIIDDIGNCLKQHTRASILISTLEKKLTVKTTKDKILQVLKDTPEFSQHLQGSTLNNPFKKKAVTKPKIEKSKSKSNSTFAPFEESKNAS